MLTVPGYGRSIYRIRRVSARAFQEIEYGHKDVQVYTSYKIANRLGVGLSEVLRSGQ